MPIQVFWDLGDRFDLKNPLELHADAGFEALPIDFNRNGWIDLFVACHRDDIGHVVSFLCCFLLCTVSCFAFAQLLSILAPNADTGTIILATSNSIFTLFCGFMLPYASIPTAWRWLYYVSMFRYPLGFLVSSELRGKTFDCPRQCTDQGGGLGVVCMPQAR